MKKVKFLIIALMILASLCAISCGKDTVVVRFDLGFDSAFVAKAEEFTLEKTLKKGETMAALPGIVLGHTHIVGWYADKELTEEWDFSRSVSKSLTLFAKWSDPVYQVTLNYNNGNSSSVLSVGEGALPTIATPTRPFYKFGGWFLDEELTTKLTDNYMLSDDITLFAKWKTALYERQSSFPAVVINTQDNADIVEKETWLNASVSITNTTEEYTITTEGFNAEIRGRGNATRKLEKKPYRIKFAKKTSLFGSDYKAKNWTLLANHNDKTLLRNYLAYNFADSLENMAFAPAAIFVDVYLNGEYRGVYQLSDHMEAGEGRVDIDTTIYENPADCDYFFELDGYAEVEPGAVEDFNYVVVEGTSFTIKSPKTDEAGWTAAHAAYLKECIQAFHDVINGDDFSLIEEMVDIPSFIDNIMVYELFKNLDADNWSSYLYIKDGKVYAGPIWDFDLTAGISKVVASCEGTRINRYTFFSHSLMKHQSFYTRFVDRWKEIAETKIDDVFGNIIEMGINNAYSMQNNYEVWGINDYSHMGSTFPDYESNETYISHIEYLKNWLLGRVEWMNGYYVIN